MNVGSRVARVVEIQHAKYGDRTMKGDGDIGL